MAEGVAYWRETPTRWGTMYVPKGDKFVGASLIAYGEFSPGEWRFLVNLLEPGMTVLDIGANIGALTLPLAQQVGIIGSVYAFEPQPELANLLAKNVAQARIGSPVSIIRKAVGKEAATLSVPPLDYAREFNFGGVELGKEGRPVDVITVDSLDLPECHLIKADVEGMELDVLLGAQQTIARHRPMLYIEADQQPKVPALKRQLSKMRYRWYQHRPRLWSADNWRGLLWPLKDFDTTVSINLVCIPQERPKADWEKALEGMEWFE